MILTNILRATVHKFKGKVDETTWVRGIRFFFKDNLLITNSISSGICMAIGDFVHQKYEMYSDVKKKSHYDWPRAGHMFLAGTAMGPLHHYYYIYLDKILPKVNLLTVISKILTDQLIASPVTILTFFYGMGFLEKRTVKKINEEIKDKFLYVYIGDCLFWPPMQFINFYYLPTHYRVFYVNLSLILYDVFLAFMKYYDE